jgi:hypothetical protein
MYLRCVFLIVENSYWILRKYVRNKRVYYEINIFQSNLTYPIYTTRNNVIRDILLFYFLVLIASVLLISNRVRVFITQSTQEQKYSSTLKIYPQYNQPLFDLYDNKKPIARFNDVHDVCTYNYKS